MKTVANAVAANSRTTESSDVQQPSTAKTTSAQTHAI
jgi:hypothetical protein